MICASPNQPLIFVLVHWRSTYIYKCLSSPNGTSLFDSSIITQQWKVNDSNLPDIVVSSDRCSSWRRPSNTQNTRKKQLLIPFNSPLWSSPLFNCIQLAVTFVGSVVSLLDGASDAYGEIFSGYECVLSGNC